MIWTQGTSGRDITTLDKNKKLVRKNLSMGKHRSIGFCNKPHYDPNDKVSPKDSLDWVKDHKVNGIKKVKISKMHDTLGIGFPSTVGYNFCTPKEMEIMAYFMCWGFVTPITEKSFHHFYGWCFPHCSTLPIYIRGSLIITTNEDISRDDSVYIGAWGYNIRKEII